MTSVPDEIANYVSNIYEIVDKQDSDSSEIESRFNEFDYMVLNDNSLSEDNQAYVLAISAIAKYSCIYNCDAQTRTAVVSSTVAKQVVKADASGAVCSVVSLAFFGKLVTNGLMFGPGGIVLTIAKEVTVGAIVGSGVCIATQGIL